jgi:hypothetical protein
MSVLETLRLLFSEYAEQEVPELSEKRAEASIAAQLEPAGYNIIAVSASKTTSQGVRIPSSVQPS